MSIKIGAAYIRISSDDQLEYSPDSQLKVIRDHAKREGYVIPDEFVFQDDSISGKTIMVPRNRTTGLKKSVNMV